MKYFLKQVTLLYVVVGFILVPFNSYAASKKHHKSSAISAVKHKATSRSKVSARSKHLIKAKTKHVRVSGRTKSSKNYKLAKYQPTRIHLVGRKSFHLSEPLPEAKVEQYDGSAALSLASSKALVINQNTNEIIYAKNTNLPTPIASLTKLMTAMVLLDSKVRLDDEVRITEDDVDYIKGTSSRLSLGTQLTRSELLHLALIASENRAASAIASSYPAGRGHFIREMNQKALSLGMMNTHFSDSTGLDSSNVSTAEDLAKMVNAAYRYPLIREITTTPNYEIYLPNRTGLATFNNTNSLVRSGDWEIGLSKTGFITEAGRCLVMQARLAGESVIIVLLDSYGKYSRIGDANRVRKWMEYNTTAYHQQITDDSITLGQAQ